MICINESAKASVVILESPPWEQFTAEKRQKRQNMKACGGIIRVMAYEPNQK